MDHSIDPQVAEECVNDAVDCIRQFVEGLRAAFPVPKHGQEGRQEAPAASPLVLPLYTRMVERGLPEQVQRAVQRQRKEWGDLEYLEEDHNSSVSTPEVIQPYNSNDQRAALLQEIILPSLRSLTACYRILDAIPQAPQPYTPSSPSSPSSSKDRKKNKPAPPRGMLSIQHYTDVACLLEFTVCTFILPVLDPHVLSSLDDRIRHHLPKSLAGRMPRLCLTWGAACTGSQLSNGRNNNNNQNDELLLETASSISELVMLDRFRPMLLPRHIADLYAAIFQYEHNRGINSSSQMPHSLLYQSLGLQEKIAKGDDAPNSTRSLDDAALQAKSYQTLLLQGTKTPDWLRQRVAPLLTELACTNLASIVQVFVPLQQQHGEVSTMASQRLGRTLATSSANTKNYTHRLGQQIRFLLEALFSTVQSGQIPARAMAILQTIWAVLYHWPNEVVQQEFIRPWQQGLLQDTDISTIPVSKVASTSTIIHKILRQIGSLCASVPPPATDPWRILQHLFRTPSGPNTQCRSSIMNQMVRIATMRHNNIEKSVASEEAREILHWLCQATAVSSNSGTTTTKGNNLLPSGPTLLASAWVHALAPNDWDNGGYFYKLVMATEETNDPKDGRGTNTGSLERISIQKTHTAGDGIASLVEQIQKRAEIFFDTCLVKEDSPMEGPTRVALQGVSSLEFRLLLKLYLSGSQWLPSSSIHKVGWIYQLVAIVVLPSLCEKCSPEALLFGPGSETSALGLLHSIKMILVCAKARLSHGEYRSENTTVPQGDDALSEVANDDDATMIQCLNLLKFGESHDVPFHAPDSLLSLLDENEQDDTVLSIASIVLSLLIAVLELGSKLRSDEEEEALHSFIPILTVLAGFSGQACTPTTPDHGTNAGISDMSGYAIALIASRKAEARPEAAKATPSRMDMVQAMIQEAHDDLESSQPPIRARGMVSLGRLARGYLGILKPKDNKSQLIEELGGGLSSEENLIEFTVRSVLRLSIDALSDDESYVYLAAVQTIVAIGDMQAKKVLPTLGAAIVTGKVDVGVEGSSITNEQRIKLAEALMFIIRRRAAPAEYFPQLMNIMLFGSANKIGTVSNIATVSDDHRSLFTQETGNYFLGAVEDGSSASLSRQELWKEQDIRAKTGGPIFALEEHDLVRSIRLSTIAELVSVVPPSTLAPYCGLLIRLVTNVLRLDKSRTACRAAALLAREFYGCLLREKDELGALVGTYQHDESPLQLAVAIVANENDEGMLVETLLNHSTGSESFAGGRNINDLAVSARSQEALALREDGEDILEAAHLVNAAEHTNGDLPSILTSMITSSGPRSEMINVVASHPLR